MSPILKFSEIMHVTVIKKAQTKAALIRHTGIENSFYCLIIHRKETQVASIHKLNENLSSTAPVSQKFNSSHYEILEMRDSM